MKTINADIINSTTKHIEFSILAIVAKGHTFTQPAVYAEMERNPAYAALTQSEFNNKWNYLLKVKCLVFIDDIEPAKGVKINAEKSCLIIYGYQKYCDIYK